MMNSNEHLLPVVQLYHGKWKKERANLDARPEGFNSPSGIRLPFGATSSTPNTIQHESEPVRLLHKKAESKRPRFPWDLAFGATFLGLTGIGLVRQILSEGMTAYYWSVYCGSMSLWTFLIFVYLKRKCVGGERWRSFVVGGFWASMIFLLVSLAVSVSV
jgi:hypothetical protein